MGFAAAQDQEDSNVVPDSVRDDESRVDAAAKDVEASGSSGDVLQREKSGVVVALCPTTMNVRMR